MSEQPIWEEQQEVDVLEKETESHYIVVYNDEFNTFEHVIDCLIHICEHNAIQAEQCTFLIHHKGKCEVKTGDLTELMPMHKALLNKGLSSEIL